MVGIHSRSAAAQVGLTGGDTIVALGGRSASPPAAATLRLATVPAA